MLFPTPRRYTAAELELIEQRADSAHVPPYWPFAALTPMQASACAAQEAALRRRPSALQLHTRAPR